jgi:hypothetical protein
LERLFLERLLEAAGDDASLWLLIALFVVGSSVGSGSLLAPTCKIVPDGKQTEETKEPNEKCPSLDTVIFFKGIDGVLWA